MKQESSMLPLEEMEQLEDLFELLGVAFEERILAIHRMRILRRIGQEAQKIEQRVPAPSKAEHRRLCAEALRLIHEQCSRGIREPEPVFRARSPQLVQLRRKPSPTP